MPAKSRRKAKPTKPWSLYPTLHGNVARTLEQDNILSKFRPVDDTENFTESYDTNIMGRFICHNPACNSDGWSSKKIAITIRMYTTTEYNVRVYHQRCKSCSRLSRPILDESYTERVVYRIKTWKGISLPTPPYEKKTGRPHNRRLCEGCKDGHCKA
jgi:hypothetical protein